MTKQALLVHGISYFNERQALRPARLMLSRCGYHPSQVNAFNWDLTVGHPEISAEGPFNLRFLAEVGSALLESAHLGFFSRHFLDRSTILLRVQNALTFALQLAVLLFPLWLLLFFDIHRLTLLLGGIGTLVLLPLVSGVVSASRPFMDATIRRVILVCIWPFTYVVTVLIFVPGSIILLLFSFSFFSAWSVTVSPVVPINVLAMIQSVFAYVVTIGAPILVAILIVNLLPLLPIGVAAKLLADIARYIGFPRYRRELIDGLGLAIRKLNLSPDSDLLLLTHSLGSVIATDYLLRDAADARIARSVTLVTMGSPLRRYFARFFVGFYLPPDEILETITMRVNHFKWINIYRHGDPVGGSLGGPETRIIDTPTSEHLAWSSAHCGYFSSRMVYRSLEASLERPEEPPNLQINRPAHERLEEQGLGSRALGWSSASITGAVWSWRGRIIDFVSTLLPPWGFRHLALIILLAIGSGLWMLHEDSKWSEYLIWFTLAHPGEKFPTRDVHWRSHWISFELLVVMTPAVWAMCGAPFLRMALVCVDSFQSRLVGDPTEESKLRREIGRNTKRRILSLIRPMVLLALMATFLFLTGYWRQTK